MIESCHYIGRHTAGKFLAPLFGVSLALGGVLALPEVAGAQATFNPYAGISVEHDSNVFRVQDSPAAIAFAGEPLVGDTDEKGIIGTTGEYLWGLQKFSGTAEGRREEFDRLTELDHYEYLLKGQFDWKLGSLFDGFLSARQEHQMAQFANNQSNTLEVNTDRNVIERVNFYATPDWRLEAGANQHTLDSPLKFFPDYTEKEFGSHAGLSYLGIANLTYGISYDHLDGNYAHAAGVGPYRQSGETLHVTYMLNGLTSLEGSAGYAKREQSQLLGQIAGWTGSLAYERQLTAKTSFVLSGVRAINSYLASGGSEIDTTGTFGVTWHATYKIGVTATYGYTHSTFVGQAIPGSTATGRRDHVPVENANVTYDVWRHLQLKAYFTRQTRDSNVEFFNYYDTIYGIQATAHWK
jgi:hypothetical protein